MSPGDRAPWTWLTAVFPAAFGSVLGLSLLKFGNPPIMEKFTTPPNDIYEFLFGSPWPIWWAYTLLALVAALGLAVALANRPLPANPQPPTLNRSTPPWLLWLPLAWLVWEIVACTTSLDHSLSIPTVKHFAACVVCFYLGRLVLPGARGLAPFWIPLLAAFLIVLANGWYQRFGGLEATRKYFYLYIYPQVKEVPPELLKRMTSTRVFSTLFYPNTLAGALLLLLPISVGVIGSLKRQLTPPARGFLVSIAAVASLACLLWSGSKGGWLLMLVLGLLAVLRFPFASKYKTALVAAVLVVGLAGFLWRYSAFFQKGATSVSARFDYWHAAVQTTASHPLVGTGPGTFLIPYQKLKRPESELSRLVHNDYLEQASDSGLPGFLVYLAFIVTALVCAYPRLRTNDWLAFWIWLGVLGWALQSLLEFGLYVPALAWPSFVFLGLLLSRPEAGTTSTSIVSG